MFKDTAVIDIGISESSIMLSQRIYALFSESSTYNNLPKYELHTAGIVPKQIKWGHIFAYRASDAFAKGHYNLITELFSPGTNGPVDFDTYEAANISLERLYLDTMHQMDDMIFK